MEQVAIAVPYVFVADRVRLTWREVMFGMDERVFRPVDAIELASNLVCGGGGMPRVLDLASSHPNESIVAMVESLAAAEPPQDILEIRRLWAFLVLAWVLEHRCQYHDPFELVEKVYADFDYPEQVAPFVRYMPSDEPDLGGRALNEARLFAKWKDYVRSEATYFASRTSTPGS